VTLDSYLRRMIRVAAATATWLPTRAFRRGQAMVEFALIATLSMVVLLVGIQFAIIGQAALAVTQASYLGARAGIEREEDKIFLKKSDHRTNPLPQS